MECIQTIAEKQPTQFSFIRGSWSGIFHDSARERQLYSSSELRKTAVEAAMGHGTQKLGTKTRL